VPFYFSGRAALPLNGPGVLPGGAYGDKSSQPTRYYTLDPVATLDFEITATKYISRSIHRGEIPFWNPYQGLGQPFFAEGGTAVLYPLNLLRLLLPVEYWDLVNFIHLLLAALFTFMFARACSLQLWSAAFSACCIFGAGYLQGYLATNPLLAGLTWLPLVLCGVERAARGFKWSSVLWPIVAGTFCLGVGSQPEQAFYSLGAVIVYLIVGIIPRCRPSVLVKILLSGLIGTLLSAPTWVQVADDILGARDTLGYIRPLVHWNHFPAIFLPYLYGDMHQSGAFGNPNVVLPPYWAFGFIPTAISFFSIVGLVVGCIRRNATMLPIAAYTALVTLWALDVWPFGLMTHAPLLARLNTYYVMGSAQILLCVSAGYGLQWLAQTTPAHWKKVLVGWILFCLVLLYIASRLYLQAYPAIDWTFFWNFSVPASAWAVLVPWFVFLGRPQPGKGKRTYLMIAFTALACMAVATFPSGAGAATANYRNSMLLVFVIVAISLTWIVRNRRWQRSVFLTGLIVTLIVQTASFLALPSWPKRYDVFTDAVYTKKLRETSQEWRTYGMDGYLFPNFSSALGISTINYLGMLVPPTTAAFLRTDLDANQPPTFFYGLAVPGTDPIGNLKAHKRFWDYVGVRYVVSSASRFNPSDRVKESLPNGPVNVGREESSSVQAVPVPLGPPGPDFLDTTVACSDGPFDSVLVKLSNYAKLPPGQVTITVLSHDGQTIDRSISDSASVHDNSLHPFPLHGLVCENPNESVVIRLRHYRQNPNLALAGWRYVAKPGFVLQRTRNDGGGSPAALAPMPFLQPVRIPITCEDTPLVGFGVFLSTYAKRNPGKVALNVDDQSGKVILSRSLDSATVEDNAFAQFELPSNLCSAGHQLVFELSHQVSAPGSMLAIWRASPNGPVRYQLHFRVDGDYNLAFRDAGSQAAIWENTTAQPRLYLAPESSPKLEWHEAQQSFAAQQDLRRSAFLETAASESCPSNPQFPRNLPAAEITSFSIQPNIFSASVRAKTSGALVLVNSYMPGWVARVNGKVAKVVRANGTFMGTCIQAPGNYDVRFEYTPRLWHASLLLSALGLILLCLSLAPWWPLLSLPC